MTVDQLKQEMEKMNADLASISTGLDGLAKKISDEAKVFFPKWFDRTAKGAIEEYASVVNKMDHASLSKMKAELNAIVEKAPDLIDLRLTKQDSWPHKVNVPLGLGFREEIEYASKHVDRSLRHITSYLGDILFRYGVATMKSGYWKEVASTPAGQKRIEANYAYYHGSASENLTAEYVKMFGEYAQITAAIRQLEVKIEQQKAIDRFNAA